MAKEKNDFDGYEKDTLTKPRDKAWTNWMKFEKVGDKVQGYIRDVFYRKAEGMFKEQRGITLEEADGTFINVGIKRLPFVLNKTDGLRLNDPLTIVLEEELPSKTKGYNPTKVFAFYGKNLPANEKEKTVRALELEDIALGGTSVPVSEEEQAAQKEMDDM